MKSGTRTYHWDTPMGPRPTIAHWTGMKVWLGDREAAIVELGTHRPDTRKGKEGLFIDQNFLWKEHPDAATRPPEDKGALWNLHWPTPAMGNYGYYLEPGAKTARKMNHEELHRHFDHWTTSEILNWRRSADPLSERPHTYRYLVAIAAAHGVVICAELKNAAAGSEDCMKYILDAAKKADHPAWVMALPELAGFHEKVYHARHNGVQFAVIFGAAPAHAKRRFPPKGYASWKYHVSRKWGTGFGKW